MSLILTLLAGALSPQGDSDSPLVLQEVAEGLNAPIYATSIPSKPDHLWIVERPGRVVRLNLTSGERERIFNIEDEVNQKSERGLLCIAFPPKAEEDHLFYAHYNNDDGESLLSRFSRKDEGAEWKEELLLTQDQPWANHNGGQIAFGPDGMLYLGLGDGGAANDPKVAGQDLSTWLGTILRIDVEGEKTYSIPKNNPFIKTKGARPEIWHWGLRNPWRFSFDRKTGDLWIGDVGQNKWEEIDFAAVGEGGLNYGWRIREGAHDFKPEDATGKETLVDPAWEYAQGGDPRSCSVTGGYVYRGKELPKKYHGQYFFGDWQSGVVWSGMPQKGSIKGVEEHPALSTNFGLVSFAEGPKGELFLMNLTKGKVWKVISE